MLLLQPKLVCAGFRSHDYLHAPKLVEQTSRRRLQDERAKLDAQKRFTQLKAAYEVLKDPQLRQQYDRGQYVAA